MSAAVDLQEQAAAFARHGMLEDAGASIPRTVPPVTITASELMLKVFPDPRWAVPGVIAEGLTLLVGAPKIGKSWLVLNLAAAVAFGGRALGSVPVDAGDVLYVALEDPERWLKERLQVTLAGDPAPARLHLATAWPAIPDGGLHELDRWLSDHRDARLVVIDTFQRFRGPIPSGQPLYAADYAAAAAVKQLADRYRVAIVLVHHTRKASADDPLDTVSGTTGLAGAADTTCVLRRDIGRADAALYIRGRGVPEMDQALSFDQQTCTWQLIGDAAEMRQSDARRQIRQVLRSAREPMPPKAIAEALGKKDGAVRKLLHSMLKAGTVDNVGGAYRLPESPSNSGNTGSVSGGEPVPSTYSDHVAVAGQGMSGGDGNAAGVTA